VNQTPVGRRSDTREIIIRPLLFGLKDKLQVYVKKDRPESELTTQLLDKLRMAVEVIASIDKKTLEEEIMKELAPSLYLKRNCHNSNKKSKVKIEVIDSDYDSDDNSGNEDIEDVKKVKNPIKIKKDKKVKETKYTKKSAKSQVKVKPKAEPKVEPKVETKVEPKIEPKVDPKIEPEKVKIRDPRVYAQNYVGNLSDFDSDSDTYIDPYD
jgi:hypothetical protein